MPSHVQRAIVLMLMSSAAFIAAAYLYLGLLGALVAVGCTFALTAAIVANYPDRN